MQILKTKLYIPEFNRDTSVARPRLCRVMDERASIVLVSAPAGFGKTTLVSEWAKDRNTPVAWVSLEKSEDSLIVFWQYVFSAIGAVTGGCGDQGLHQILASGTGDMETILIGLINELNDLDTPLTLVLDDVHVISDKAIHRTMEFFLDHLPQSMRLILSGRQIPRLSLSKFRVSGKLVDIREKDLRFQEEETHTLLNAIHGLALSDEDIHSLKTKTEGWAAGLMLALLSIRDQGDKHSFVRAFTGSHRLILDYLMEEVLAGLAEDVRDFMCRVSVLERFCPELCDAVSDRTDSRPLIRWMETANLFLIPLDHEGEWFRFHHLFRDFLLKTLKGQGRDMEKACRGKAHAWLKGKGFAFEAYDQAILAEHFSDAADLLGDLGPGLFAQSGGFLVRQWIDRLPEPVVLTHPEVCCYHTLLCVMAGDFDRVSLLDRPEFTGNPTVAGYQAVSQCYRYFYQDGAFESCIDLVPRVFAVLPEKQCFVRELGGLLLCLSLRYSGRIQEAYDLMLKAPQTDDITPLQAINFADALMGMGRLEETLDFLDTVIGRLEKQLGDNQPPETGYLYVQKGNVLREKDRLDEALKASKKGLFFGRNNEYIEFVFLGNLEYARVLSAAGRHAEAAKAVNRSLAAAKSSATWGLNLTVAHKVRMEIAKGNLGRAEGLLNEIGDFDGLDIPYHRSNEWLSYCRLCLARKRFGRVHEVTDLMINEDLGSQRKARLMECFVLKALAYRGEQRLPQALSTVSRAFELTRHEGYVRLYLDEGKPMAELLMEASGQKGFPEYLKPYVDDSGDETPSRPRDRTVTINTFSETFNEREIEILTLMKDGCSNKMIAETLFLSVHTVRWYASRIFAKLDVKRRGEAVAHAEKYSLI